jgi:hypothetical protein
MPFRQHGTNHYTAAEITALGSGMGPNSGVVPVGGIIMWSGLLSAIPTGWHLCDGDAGTPDLSGKFVKGAATGENPGATGGDTVFAHSGTDVANHADHTHPYSDVIEHTHPVTDPGHVHDQRYRNSGTAGSAGVQGCSSANNASIASGVPNHTTGISINNPVGAVAEGETDGLDQALTHLVTQPDDHEGVEPPYYAVAFIMRIS